MATEILFCIPWPENSWNQNGKSKIISSYSFSQFKPYGSARSRLVASNVCYVTEGKEIEEWREKGGNYFWLIGMRCSDKLNINLAESSFKIFRNAGMMTLQHDKYHLQSTSEQKLLSVAVSKSKKTKRNKKKWRSADRKWLTADSRLCIFGSAADRFIQWIWTNHDTLLTRKSNFHSEAMRNGTETERKRGQKSQIITWKSTFTFAILCLTVKFHTLYWIQLYREEKSLRHVATVAKFLDDNKPKTSLKKWIRTVSNFDHIIQFHLICKMMAKFSGAKSERTFS